VQQREGAVVELHHHALQRLLRFLVGNLEHLQDHRLGLPSISPLAMRKSRLYPIWPAAPVTATRMGLLDMERLSLEKTRIYPAWRFCAGQARVEACYNLDSRQDSKSAQALRKDCFTCLI